MSYLKFSKTKYTNGKFSTQIEIDLAKILLLAVSFLSRIKFPKIR